MVRHHLLDFGSTIGSAGVYPREAFEGWETWSRASAPWPEFRRLACTSRTGARFRCIARARWARSLSITATWDPEEWKPRYANSAFRSARLDDAFWAARRLQGFTDDMLKAVPCVGHFGDAEIGGDAGEVPDRSS